MKRMVACLLVLGGISVLMSGCQCPISEKTSTEKTVEKAAVPIEASAVPEAPKDHPAH